MPVDPAHLPSLNASLNLAALALLTAGWVLIRAGRRRAHAAAMVAAFVVSALFLTSYSIYHFGYPQLERRFTGTGWVRSLYFFILLTHIPLAALVPPLAGTMLWLASRGRFDRHRRLGRWVLPIWMYVSVSGVLVYWMLYRMR